jgi:hypothetical protein
MTTLPGNLETDPRFPSGRWVGFFTQDIVLRGRQMMEMDLVFSEGRFHGEGRDRVGRFAIDGTYSVDDGRCVFLKHYIGRHSVDYQGFNEGKGIWGGWEIVVPTMRLHGGFHIWPEEMGDPTLERLSEEADVPLVVEDELQPA